MDDYFFVALLANNCDWQVTIFLNICDEINFPVSRDKTEWSTQEIVFLGLLLNTILQTVSIPEQKRDKALDAIDRVIRSKKVKVLDMQKLTGLLNFLSRAIVPGRTFTRRMYAKFKNMKQHHHVRVDGELRADCQLWAKFLLEPRNTSRPFIDFTKELTAEVIRMESDASLNKHFGIGGLFLRSKSKSDHNDRMDISRISWFSQKWPKDFIQTAGISIEVAELLGACMGVSIWAREIEGKRVVIWCDNQAVVQMINNCSSACKKCMFLLRHLTLLCMDYRIRVFCRYISTKENRWADQLSRMKVATFLSEARQCEDMEVDHYPSPLSTTLWPIPKALWEQ